MYQSLSLGKRTLPLTLKSLVLLPNSTALYSSTEETTNLHFVVLSELGIKKHLQLTPVCLSVPLLTLSFGMSDLLLNIFLSAKHIISCSFSKGPLVSAKHSGFIYLSIFYFSLILKDSFVGYPTLGCWLFSHRILNILFYCSWFLLFLLENKLSFYLSSLEDNVVLFFFSLAFKISLTLMFLIFHYKALRCKIYFYLSY